MKNKTMFSGLRIVVWFTLAFVLSACGSSNSGGGASASGSSSALFIDTAYVDYLPADTGSEAANLEATIDFIGAPATTFTGITGVEWTAAIAGKNTLLIPELNADLFAALDAAAVTAITNFVNGGGTLIVIEAPVIPLLNGVFGFTIATAIDTGPANLAAAAIGTPFAGGPASLLNLSATGALSIASLPVGSRAIYVDSTNADSSWVTVIPVGSGQIVHIGWDWFNAAPVGANDGGWVDVLGRALQL